MGRKVYGIIGAYWIWEDCSICDTTGKVLDDEGEEVTCPACDGAGEIEVMDMDEGEDE